MKLAKAAALLAALAITGYAYADAIVAASVSNQNLNGGLCSSAAASSSSISLKCGSGADGLAQVNAAVGPLNASMQVFLNSYGNPMAPGTTTLALANLSWGIDGIYILTGGSGSDFFYRGKGPGFSIDEITDFDQNEGDQVRPGGIKPHRGQR